MLEHLLPFLFKAFARQESRAGKRPEKRKRPLRVPLPSARSSPLPPATRRAWCARTTGQAMHVARSVKGARRPLLEARHPLPQPGAAWCFRSEGPRSGSRQPIRSRGPREGRRPDERPGRGRRHLVVNSQVSDKAARSAKRGRLRAHGISGCLSFLTARSAAAKNRQVFQDSGKYFLLPNLSRPDP